MDKVNYYIKKMIFQVSCLFLLLLLQLLVLTNLAKHDKIKLSIGTHNDSEIDASQSQSEETTNFSSNGFSSDFLLGDLNRNGIIDDEDYKWIQEYGKHPETLPEDLYDIANVNEDDSFDVRDVTEFKRKYIIGE